MEIVCSNCGGTIDSGDAVCKFCGAAVAPQQPQAEAAPVQQPPVQEAAQPQTPPVYGGQPVPPAGQTYQQPPVAPGYMPQQPYVPAPGTVQKSRVAAGVLGILLGSLGIHNFYLGNTGKAVAQLLISVLSCGMLSIVSFIWGLVEGIQILTGSITTDAKGVPLKD